jgi:hypothetical protein
LPFGTSSFGSHTFGGGPTGTTTSLTINATSTPAYSLTRIIGKILGITGASGASTTAYQPDTIVSSSNLTGATTTNLAAQDLNFATPTVVASATSLRLGFPSPTGPLYGTQKITVESKKTSAGIVNPTFSIAALMAGETAQTATSVTNTTGTVTQTSTGKMAWTSPSSAVLSDNQYATFGGIGSPAGDSEILQFRGCGFSIPSDATIYSIGVQVEAQSQAGGAATKSVQLVKAGTPVGADRGDGLTWANGADIVGWYGDSGLGALNGSQVDMWGTTWTPADINDTNFGVNFQATSPNSDDGLFVDQISIMVRYYRGGSGTISQDFTVSSTAASLTVFTFNASLLSSTDGSNFEILIQGTGASNNGAAIGYVNWDASVGTPIQLVAPSSSAVKSSSGTQTPKTISSVVTPAFNIVKQVPKALSLATTSAFNTIKAAAKKVTATSTPTFSTVRSVGKAIVSSTTNTFSTIRQTIKPVTATTTETFAVAKAVTKTPITSTATPAYSLAKGSVRNRTVSSLVTPAYSIVKSTGKAIALAITPAFTFARTVIQGKIINAAIQPAYSLVKGTARLITAVSQPVFTFVRQASQARVISATSQPAYSTQRISGKNISSLSTPVFTVLKQTSRAINSSLTPLFTFSRTASQARVITATSQPNYSLTRIAAKSLTLAAGTTYSIMKSVSRQINSAAQPAMIFARSALQARTISASAQPAGSVVRITAKNILLAATSAYSMLRGFGKTLAYAVSPAPSVNRTAAQARIINAVSQPTSSVIKLFSRAISSASQPVVAFAKQLSLGRSIGAAAFAEPATIKSKAVTYSAETTPEITFSTIKAIAVIANSVGQTVVQAGHGVSKTVRATIEVLANGTKTTSATLNGVVDIVADYAAASFRFIVLDVQTRAEATSDAGKAFIHLVDVLVGLDVAVARNLGKTILSVPQTIFGLSKGIAVAPSVDVVPDSSSASSVGKTLGADASVEASADAMKVLIVLFNSAVGSVAELGNKVLGKALQVSSDSIAFIQRGFAKVIRVRTQIGKAPVPTVGTFPRASLTKEQAKVVEQSTTPEPVSVFARGKIIAATIGSTVDSIIEFIKGLAPVKKPRGGRGAPGGGLGSFDPYIAEKKKTAGVTVQLGENAAYKEYELDEAVVDIRINIQKT